jgi:drug/metabolite transporter (DMT)-like permease
LSPFVFCVVLGAAALHATWNALVKHGGDPFLRLAVVCLVSGLAAAPFLFFVTVPAVAAWPWLLVSLVTHLAYYVCLGLAYRGGDLSLVYPIARGVAPPLVALGGFLIAGEALGLGGTLALLLICGGILTLALGTGRAVDPVRTLAPALACGACIAAYTVADGLGARAADGPAGYIVWLFFLDGFAFSGAIFWIRRRDLAVGLRRGLAPAAIGGVLSFLAYALVIWAMTWAPLALVSALRETSVVLAALIGSTLLGEPFGRRRLASACLVALGVGLLELGSLA